MSRVILHIDVDNFYVAVECADDATLRGKPLAVVQQNAGGIVALSEEAKVAGLRKGDGVGDGGRTSIPFLVEMESQSLDECKRRCPGLVIRSMRVDRYREAGASILRVLERWEAPVQKTSYDDFYVDLSNIVAAATGDPSKPVAEMPPEARIVLHDASISKGTSLPEDLTRGCMIAADMRAKMLEELGLVASVGVGRTKLSARMLSPRAKPDG